MIENEQPKQTEDLDYAFIHEYEETLQLLVDRRMRCEKDLVHLYAENKRLLIENEEIDKHLQMTKELIDEVAKLPRWIKWLCKIKD